MLYTHTHSDAHLGLFSTDMGVLHKAPIQKGLCKALVQRGFHKASIEKGLCTHIHTYVNVLVYFPTDTGFFSQSPYADRFMQSQTERGLCEIPTHKGLCKASMGFAHIEGTSQNTYTEGTLQSP